jgi:hypothetical protein
MTTNRGPLDVALTAGVTRLCHFTPSLNLPHILGDQEIRTTSELTADVRACFSPTDLQRLDGHPNFVCCSIEYPNLHYLARARERGRLAHFPDWLVFLLDPTLLERSGALFSPRNAAAGHGAFLKPGIEGLEECYAPAIEGAGGYTFTRSPSRLTACPTDEQAEVLIPGSIALDHVLGIAVRDETQAKAELARLRIAGISIQAVRLIIAPVLFDRAALSSAIRNGQRPTETPWNGEEDD